MSHKPTTSQTRPLTRLWGLKPFTGLWGALTGMFRRKRVAYSNAPQGLRPWIKEVGHDLMDVPPNPSSVAIMEDFAKAVFAANPDNYKAHHRTLDQFGVSRIYDKDGNLTGLTGRPAAKVFGFDQLPTEHIIVEDEE